MACWKFSTLPQARNQLGAPWGTKSFLRGAHIFQRGRIFSQGVLRRLVTGLLYRITSQMFASV